MTEQEIRDALADINRRLDDPEEGAGQPIDGVQVILYMAAHLEPVDCLTPIPWGITATAAGVPPTRRKGRGRRGRR